MKILTPFKIIATFILLSSCSISKKINRPAKEYLLHNPVFISAHTGISIYEPESGTYWYDYQGEKYFTPASNRIM
jgi:D-alanyl-D-alanine carboxypeptidase/D-alanyl-D-alanine-endopeptidase (penicillin-binding protein 4)